MIKETISKLEAKLRSSQCGTEEARQEILTLLGQLKSEVSGLAKTHSEEAETIAGLAARTTREATRENNKNPEVLKRSLDELGASVEGFEESHPKLVEVVNRIATTLSNLGI